MFHNRLKTLINCVVISVSNPYQTDKMLSTFVAKVCMYVVEYKYSFVWATLTL